MPRGRKRVFGHVPDVEVGQAFRRREDLADKGVHGPLQNGIWGDAATGAESIVISGGYVDDGDHGEVVIYTGHGGRDANTGRQVKDQDIHAPGNAGLVTSQAERLPVRVTRGIPGRTKSAAKTYRYDGLYWVIDHWRRPGSDGYLICQYELEAIPGESSFAPLEVASSTIEASDMPLPAGVERPGRRTSVLEQIIRNRPLAWWIKNKHDYQCQVCRVRIETRVHPYAEAAHIRGLGYPHYGPDEVENLLVLCPNHHKMFDLGAIVVTEDRLVVDVIHREIVATLVEVDDHPINSAYLRYHLDLHAPKLDVTGLRDSRP